ncbi:hypothetical protein C8Q80DRAFT_1267219 [Daedaleopsis nitida]|nr:hypothetical protein C8Q80DRAFT_1267219 [Daedaleopsis nitida]
MSSLTAFAGDDPRDSEGEVDFSIPKSWQADNLDALSSSMMFVSMLIMATRNRYLAWPSLLLSINSVVNQHPLRAKEGGSSNAGVLVFAISALVFTYLPLFMIGPSKTTAPTALGLEDTFRAD